jgi:hypothetical protein
MFTVKGNIIDIDGKTEWLLFHRLSKKINPVDFLALTDSIIQFPNFLYTISFLIMVFIKTDTWIQFTVPSVLFILAQLMIRFQIGTFILKPFRVPLLAYLKFSMLFSLVAVAAAWYNLGWWSVLVIPLYLVTLYLSLFLLTADQKKKFRVDLKRNIDVNDIFKNNSFLFAYYFYAADLKLSEDLSPGADETKNEDWLKPYLFMRTHWTELESHFSAKARAFWRAYLHLT